MNVRITIDKKQAQAAIDRARRANIVGADFLLQRLVEDFGDRLSVTNRTFKDALFISPFNDLVGGHFSKIDSAPDLTGYDPGSAQTSADELGMALGQADLLLDIANLHQANDLPGMLIQYRRALREDGLFLSCIPGGDTLFELRQSLLAAEVELSGGAHARVLPFLDVRSAGGLLQRAGFALPVTDIDTLVVRYDNMYDLMLDLRAMGATNTLLDRPKRFSRRELFQRAAQHYAENFSDSDGRIRATFSFIWLSGWAPSQSQQKPLKPGSATHSLAKVLKDKSGIKS